MQLPLPISSQHTSIFSIRAFSAPPTDGQLLFTFFIAKQQLLRLDSLTFMVFMYSFKCTLHIIWVTCSLRGRGGMTTSCLCFTHGWLCWVSFFFFFFFFLLGQNAQQKRQRQRGRERGEDREREKRVRGVCMSECCKIKLDPRLFFFFFFFFSAFRHIPGLEAPFLWASLPTWPIRRSFCCKRVCWEYLNWIWITIWRRPFSSSNVLLATGTTTDHTVSTRALKHTICCTSCPPQTSTHTHTHTHTRTHSLITPAPVYLYVYLYLSLTHTHTHTHTHSQKHAQSLTHTHAKEDATAAYRNGKGTCHQIEKVCLFTRKSASQAQNRAMNNRLYAGGRTAAKSRRIVSVWLKSMKYLRIFSNKWIRGWEPCR